MEYGIPKVKRDPENNASLRLANRDEIFQDFKRNKSLILDDPAFTKQVLVSARRVDPATSVTDKSTGRRRYLSGD